jgi:hypothetical protein
MALEKQRQGQLTLTGDYTQVPAQGKMSVMGIFNSNARAKSKG